MIVIADRRFADRRLCFKKRLAKHGFKDLLVIIIQSLFFLIKPLRASVWKRRKTGLRRRSPFELQPFVQHVGRDVDVIGTIEAGGCIGAFGAHAGTHLIVFVGDGVAGSDVAYRVDLRIDAGAFCWILRLVVDFLKTVDLIQQGSSFASPWCRIYRCL